MERHHLDIMAISEAQSKSKDLLKAINYTYTEEDVKKMIERRKKFLSKPVNFAAERAALMTKRDAAKDLNQMDEYNRLCKQLEQLDEREKEHRAKLKENEREDNLSSADKLKLINKKNKQSNISAVC
jgi:hypothetical protein